MYSLNYVTTQIEFSLKLNIDTIKSITKITPSKLAIITDDKKSYTVVTKLSNNFVMEKILYDDPSFFLVFPQEKLKTPSSNYLIFSNLSNNITFVKSDCSQSIISLPYKVDSPDQCFVLPNTTTPTLVLIHPTLVFVTLTNNSQQYEISNISNISKGIGINENQICVMQGPHVNLINIHQDYTISISQNLEDIPSEKNINLNVISKSSFIISFDSVLNHYTLIDGTFQKTTAVIQSDLLIKYLIPFVDFVDGPHIYLGICDNGAIYLIRIQQAANQGLETYPLPSFCKAKIKFCVCAFDSFLVIYENNESILYESFPEWYTIPYYYSWFENTKSEESNKI